ncbi:unnamed protein product [Ceratitis capitata]|uniref:(Mediterranean fruit fly) hypothetical protein n=1 Tax=Ceratitis capitata TaxID=7213 RepID=A0A811VEP9_CERCA|nr:unnamed protein product [Ceratitis capitata]
MFCSNFVAQWTAGSSSQPLRPNEDGSHHLQEYTYKKITACDVCSQILREFTDIDQVYRVLKQKQQQKIGEFKSANITASTTGTGVIAAGADKSVQGSNKTDGPDIQIMNVPDYPERTGIIGGPGSSSSTGGLSAIAATAVAAAQRAGRGVRPPPVPVPILGVQLQQQELAQQRSGGLPVPQQDVSSSSGPP